MDIEEKQAEHIDYFVKKASNLKGSALADVVVEATSHPHLFGFSEILAVHNVLEVCHACICRARAPFKFPFWFLAKWILLVLLAFRSFLKLVVG